MNRRQVLGLAAAGLPAIAGCLGGSPDASTPDDTTEPTDTGRTSQSPTTTERPPRVEMGETATVGGREVTLSDPLLRKGVYTEGVHDPQLVVWRGQFVVVTMRGTTLRSLDALRVAVPGDDEASQSPTPTLAEGEYAVPIPTGEHETVELVVENAGESTRWRLPPSVADQVGSMPQFGVESAGFVRDDGDLLLELTIRNDGDRDGQFVATASSSGFTGNRTFDFHVPAGESQAYTGRAGGMTTLFDNDGGTFVIEYPGTRGVERHEMSETPPETTMAG